MAGLLHIPCVTLHYFPETLENLLKLCVNAKIECMAPEQQTCCGLPYFEKGELKSAKIAGEYNLEVFGNNKLVCGSPKCFMTYTVQYPKIFNNTVSHNAAVALGKQVISTEKIIENIKFTNAELITGNFLFINECNSSADYADFLKIFTNCTWHHTELNPTCCGAGACLPVKNITFASGLALNIIREAESLSADIVCTDDICRKHLLNVAENNKLTIRIVNLIDLLAKAL